MGMAIQILLILVPVALVSMHVDQMLHVMTEMLVLLIPVQMVCALVYWIVRFVEVEQAVLELTTDNYPGETAWNIKNSSGDEKYNGSGYSDANTLHSINMCLASDEYTFTITDAYGDGICCSYGN